MASYSLAMRTRSRFKHGEHPCDRIDITAAPTRRLHLESPSFRQTATASGMYQDSQVQSDCPSPVRISEQLPTKSFDMGEGMEETEGAATGGISEKSSAERERILQGLFDSAVLPQRQRLLAYRDLTWQSAYVDDDGYLAEMIAAIVTGTPGTTRRGVSRTTGDLEDGTEVKKGHRVDPNIDFIFHGQMNRQVNAIELCSVPDELGLHDIRVQLNANACSVQVIGRDGDRSDIGLPPLGMTSSNNALVLHHGSPRIQLSRLRKYRLPGIAHGERFVACIRQERGHVNFGAKTSQQLGAILASQPVMVFYQHDTRGRYSLAVVGTQLPPDELRELLNRVYDARTDVRRQVQPYLFPDNVREAFYRSPTASVAHALGASLLAYAVASVDGLEILHWDPDGSTRVADLEPLLTRWEPAHRCPPFTHAQISGDWGNQDNREAWARDFYRDCMQGHYQLLARFCQLTSTTRNLGFGNLSQHLVSLVAGIRGTRSGARGGDLVEADGSLSEIKLATGQRGGDAMETEDSPRLTPGLLVP